MRQHITKSLSVCFAALMIFTLFPASASYAQQLDQILRGYEIAAGQGISLNLRGKDWSLVGLGSYLVNSTGCNDCHTHPNWAATGNPYNGQTEQINTPEYLAGGRTFGMDMTVNPPVPIVSANITPDKTGKPAGPVSQRHAYRPRS